MSQEHASTVAIPCMSPTLACVARRGCDRLRQLRHHICPPIRCRVATRGCDSCDTVYVPHPDLCCMSLTLACVAMRVCNICDTMYGPPPWAVSQQEAATVATLCMSPNLDCVTRRCCDSCDSMCAPPHPRPCRNQRLRHLRHHISPPPRAASQQDLWLLYFLNF